MMRRILLLAVLAMSTVVPAAGARGARPLIEIERQFSAGHYTQLRQDLEAAIRESPQDARLHFWLARSAYELMEFDSAITAAERACELEPKNAEYRLWLARSVGRKAERERSFFLARRTKRELEEAVRLDASNVRARRDLAEYYSDAPWILGGSKSKARQQADEIRRLDPIEGILAMADYYRNIGQPDDANQQYRLLLDRKPARAEPYFEALDFYESRGDAAQMQVFLDQAGARDSADPRLLYFFGSLHAISGTQLDEAESRLRGYLAAVPNRSDLPTYAAAHERLGQIFEEQQKFSAAEAEYRAAVQLDPQRKRFREALHRVEKKS